MNKHPLSHTQHTAGQPNMKQEERKKRETKTSASKQHMLSPPPTSGGTTMVIRADLIGREGLGNEIWKKRGKDTNPITHKDHPNPHPTNKGGSSDTAHVKEG